MQKQKSIIISPTHPFQTVQRAKTAIANTKRVEDEIVKYISVEHTSFENVFTSIHLGSK